MITRQKLEEEINASMQEHPFAIAMCVLENRYGVDLKDVDLFMSPVERADTIEDKLLEAGHIVINNSDIPTI